MIETKSRLAYDIKCKTKCKTRSLDSFLRDGTDVDYSRHGYEYDKPCKFPFKINNQTFHGCVWSDSHDSIGPWCYTETYTGLQSKTKRNEKPKYVPRKDQGKPKKWGICSDDCPVEDCDLCRSPEDGNIRACKTTGWQDNGPKYHFGAALWCYTGIRNQGHREWKFCSENCKNHPLLINSICKETFNSTFSDKSQIRTLSKCRKREESHNHTSCPIATDENKYPTSWAICADDCPSILISNDIYYSLSIFLPIIGVLLMIMATLICWRRRKLLNTGRFAPKNKLDLKDIGRSKGHGKTQERKSRKYQVGLEMDHKEGIVCESHLLNRNFTSSLEGDLTKINPTKSLNEQVHIIPYNSRYEVDFSCFTTQKIVGSGNFGTVYEGEASIPLLSTEKMKVAIKTVTQQSNQDQFSALISEIKILSNLDPHVNLVNMLGCCTSRLAAEGKVWLFLEYCNESDIKTYLIEHTKVFMTGIISYIL